MANRMPSMLALLGLLAVAGYQNRDKIAAGLEGLRQRGAKPGEPPEEGIGGVLAGLGSVFGAGGGNVLSGGLGDLIDTFKGAGQGEVADSWVNPNVPTKSLTPSEVEQAIGSDNLDELSTRTGLSREELLERLATAIPETVDRLTPEGRMPDESQAQSYFRGGA